MSRVFCWLGCLLIGLSFVPNPSTKLANAQTTSYQVQAEFQEFWQANGGAGLIGEPISEALWFDGQLVQYFANQRLHWVNNQVVPAKLGLDLFQASRRTWQNQRQHLPTKQCLWVESSKRSICEPFLSFWQANGEANSLGNPITETVTETNPLTGKIATMQYFEQQLLAVDPASQQTKLSPLGQWQASWLLNGTRQASPIRATLSGPQAALTPLEQLIIQIDAGTYVGPASLRIVDSAGQLETSQNLNLTGQSQSLKLQAQGALGQHYAVLLIEGKVAAINSSIYQLDARTSIQTGVAAYDTMPSKVEEFLRNDVSSYEYNGYPIRGYRSPDSYLIWLRDHVHQGLGYRYFEHDMTSTLDYFRREQKANGAFDDYFAMVNGEPVQGRIEVEADLEYLFVQGVYQAWQATGDSSWMLEQKPAMLRGINYSLSDPQRWNPDLQLIRRPYTIDTWDFEYGGPTIAPDGKSSPRHWIDAKTRFGIMHGDNTGMAHALALLGKLEVSQANFAQANEWLIRSQQLTKQLNQVAWNGKFYIHNVLEQPFDIPEVDEARQLSLSNSYALNRYGMEASRALAIIDEYYQRRVADSSNLSSEWFSIDPPFPAERFGTTPGWGNQPGEYVNGGRMPLVGGELARGTFRWGQPAYGFDILRRYAQMIEAQGGSYLWYYPAGNPGVSGPQTLATDGWGSTAMLAALIEGAAGVTDQAALYQHAILSPRWIVEPEVQQAQVTARYAASQGYVSYRWQRQTNGFQLDFTGSGQETTLQLFLPNDAPANVKLTINGLVSFGHERSIGPSRYLEVRLTKATGTVNVSW
ncbi:hypothetical protein [Herpetosiphon sp. NSE202]|uniref:hypothetical protein n=1 Tax=Herpetosiphon sp. NSE202 TaxID=3351349 RepID=UPI00362A00E0